jgi:hypothetical protein
MVEAPARMTVFHNGVLVQDNVELWGPTEWQKFKPYSMHPDKLPISLQDHGNPVRFRNIWVRELSETHGKAPDYLPAIELGESVLEKYAGTYVNENNDDWKIEIRMDNGKLIYMRSPGRNDELIPHSKKKFSLRFTAIDLEFRLDKAGNPLGMTYTFTGETFYFKKIE